MKNRKLISVVIPCYNHDKFIRKTVMSVLQQTYDNIELLVADDCSTDNSAAVLRQIQDPRLKTFFFEKNHGTVYTLNFLLKKASGDYIATLGSDDFFSPDKLEKQLKFMEENPSYGAVFSWAEIVDENDMPYTKGDSMSVSVFQVSNRSQGEWLRYFFEDGNHLCHSSALIRREVQQAVGLYHFAYRQLHDFDMWLRLLCKYPIHIIQEKLVGYRRQNQYASVSINSSANQIRHFNECSSIFLRLFKEMPEELFLNAFSDMLAEESALDDGAILVQKYKVLRRLNFVGCSIRSAAQELFVDGLDDTDFFNMKLLESRELLDLLYSDTSKFAVEYPAEEEQIAELLPEAARHYKNMMDSLTTQKNALEQEKNALRGEIDALNARCNGLERSLQEVFNSTSWKFTRPMRKISALIGKKHST